MNDRLEGKRKCIYICNEVSFGKLNVRRHAVYVYGNREVDHVFENLI